MNKLYIIGNGFDLHHYIKTNYADFRRFLRANYSDLFDNLELYYNMDEDSLLWSELEKGLKDFDPTNLEDDFGEYLPDYSSDDFRDRDRYDLQIYIKDELDPIQKELQIAFNAWIASKKIPLNIYSRKIKIDANAIFLNFNYTDTLEKVYNIPRDKITYIHNKSGEDNADLLFGHAWKPNEWAKQREPVMPSDLDDEEKQEWIDRQSDSYDYSIMLAYQEIDDFFSKIYKDCDSIIDKNKPFFQQLQQVNDIFIFGHSLSEVDKPYFEEIAKHIHLKDVHWTISYYEDEECISHQKFMEELGVDLSMVAFVKLDELLVSPITTRVLA